MARSEETTWKNNTTGSVVFVAGLIGTILVFAGIVFGLRSTVPVF